MKRYARIIVDISASEVNQVYDYLLPENDQKYKIGHLVEIPFGNRTVRGFIIGFAQKPAVDEKKVKPVKDLVLSERLFNEKMLKLFRWLAGYYNCYLINVIKTALPAGIVSGRVSARKKKYVRAAQKQEELAERYRKIKTKAPKQARVLKIFINEDKAEYTVNQLVEKANCYRGAVYKLVHSGVLQYIKKRERRNPFQEKQDSDIKKVSLTSRQQEVLARIEDGFDSQDILLLHGVTGSGKTEVYLRVVEKLVASGQGAIILVPEIALTPVILRRFYNRFGSLVAVLHSDLSAGERFDEWYRIKQGSARIVIGARSAVFAPVADLGIIIIDEEHENTYKQETYPHYDARKVAAVRGRIAQFPLLLGSATPSLEIYYQAKKNNIEYLSLPERVKQAEMPVVRIIDMREELKKGNPDIFSGELQQAINEALGRQEQALLFLNRRGYSSFVLCRECGNVISCKYCDISLTYHAAENLLRCHYCDFQDVVPRRCPDCGSKYIREFGTGTEKIEQLASEEFPEAEIARMDVDTTSGKGAHKKILTRVENGEIDILVGTQMIAKGHDYPNIGVVGVISADTILNLPDFRSSERTFQLLTQVAGRTGRGSAPGRVYIQTYDPEHYSIEAASQHDYRDFYTREIKLRRQLEYPPFTHLVNIIIRSKKEDTVAEISILLEKFLKKYFSGEIKELLGPSPAPIKKIRGKYRWQLILKFSQKIKRRQVLDNIRDCFVDEYKREVDFNIDVDPRSML